MIAVLMVLVFAVVMLGWLMAAAAFVAIGVSMIPRVLDRSSAVVEERASAQSRWPRTDAQFLRDVGIRP